MRDSYKTFCFLLFSESFDFEVGRGGGADKKCTSRFCKVRSSLFSPLPVPSFFYNAHSVAFGAATTPTRRRGSSAGTE